MENTERQTAKEIEEYLIKINNQKPRIIIAQLSHRYGVDPRKYKGIYKIEEFIEITERNQEYPSPLEKELIWETIDFRSA
ncbi:hypothetical protein HOD88_00335 [archaeon]|jgi:hypothetical protein|nr:hypothetical protein [archaeon]